MTHHAFVPRGSAFKTAAAWMYVAAGIAFFSGCGAQDSAPARRPSFVLILADDLGWADVGYQGSSFHLTPHIDALARRGLVFSNAYAPAPVCSPARAAILTGQSPARSQFTSVLPKKSSQQAPPTGPVSNGPADKPYWQPVSATLLPKGAPTLASHLSQAGYRTAMIGKWHLGTHPREAGFKRLRGTTRGGVLSTYFSPYGLRLLPDGPAGEYITDRLTDEAIEFLEDCGDEPFLLYLSHFAPHSPFEAKPDLVQAYEQRATPGAPQSNATYAAMIHSLDESVGRVVAALERLGRAQDTLIVFTSDNGGFEYRPASKRYAEAVSITSNAPLRDGKGRLYEGGVRVPMIVAGAGVSRGGESTAAHAIGMDFLPTFAAMAGLATPAELDGVDLSALFRQELPLERPDLVFHFPHQNTLASSLLGSKYKLIHFYNGARDELYDLDADISEAHDLAPLDRERTLAMRHELFRRLDQVNASYPVRNPAFP